MPAPNSAAAKIASSSAPGDVRDVEIPRDRAPGRCARIVVDARDVREDQEHAGVHDRRADREAVEAVGEVDRVGGADDDERAEHRVQPTPGGRSAVLVEVRERQLDVQPHVVVHRVRVEQVRHRAAGDRELEEQAELAARCPPCSVFASFA